MGKQIHFLIKIAYCDKNHLDNLVLNIKKSHMTFQEETNILQ